MLVIFLMGVCVCTCVCVLPCVCVVCCMIEQKHNYVIFENKDCLWKLRFSTWGERDVRVKMLSRIPVILILKIGSISMNSWYFYFKKWLYFLVHSTRKAWKQWVTSQHRAPWCPEWAPAAPFPTKRHMALWRNRWFRI